MLAEQEQEPRRGFGLALLVGAAVVAVLLVGSYLLVQRHSPAAAEIDKPLPFGAAEEAYAEHIHFLDLKMSRAANFLSQEFTFLFGTVANDGNRTILRMEVTVEFRDTLNQVILRETHRLLGRKSEPLNGGFRRDFELSFEHIPDSWNRQYPSIRVTGLVLED